jgi:hypothetical protein
MTCCLTSNGSAEEMNSALKAYLTPFFRKILQENSPGKFFRRILQENSSGEK